MTALDDAADATLRVLELRTQLAVATAEREDAVRRVHFEDGIPKVHVGNRLRTRLAVRGIEERTIDSLGVSDWSIRNMLDK